MRLSEAQICNVIDREPGLQSELRFLADLKGGWARDRSTQGLVRWLRLEETAWRIDARQATLSFDGSSLRWLENGLVSRRWPAMSGKRGFSGAEHQAARSQGPIPAGHYVARQQRLDRWDDVSLVKKLLAIANRGPFPSGPMAWGHHRIWLDALPGTRTFGRSGFSIHGGWVAGSNGCIDLTSGMDSFVGEFIYYAKDMDLAVSY